MKYLGPTPHPRLNEAAGFVFLATGLIIFFSLVSYNPLDPSLNTATGSPTAAARVANLIGPFGATISDLLLQCFGLASYAIPILILLLGLKWVRSSPVESPGVKSLGGVLLICSTCTAFGLTSWKPISGKIPASGMAGSIVADSLISSMNLTGAFLLTAMCWIVSIYLVSKFEVSMIAGWFRRPIAAVKSIASGLASLVSRFNAWQTERARMRMLRRKAEKLKPERLTENSRTPAHSNAKFGPPIVDPSDPNLGDDAPPFDIPPEIDDIPIRALEYTSPPQAPIEVPAAPAPALSSRASRREPAPSVSQKVDFKLPPTNLLQEPAERSAFDSQELKEIALRIKSKFEEFNVRGSVTQINPGPVVTTFEFKPEAGVKYSRITTLSEDLCLGLQAESILIERIPGKPTVGIEVPNSKREVISLRQILESEEFDSSASPLTMALGKDINGRIKVTALDSMPHLLIAGSTGSGKSVMLNSMIMSILYKAKPNQVRMIMVDPKRLEFGPYEGIPHLLTPVITDPKKATFALRNAVLEMERRLKLLASQGVRNIDQYNKKVRQIELQPRNLFEDETEIEALEQIPYVLIIIDELADLMMLERANVEESVTRLAQMARAVGMHLVLATQRPSVDVITGLIKANFPSRISFRVATRVDSRTVLDVMGAEHLLGKGDMLFLPPGSSRLTRVHGAFVSEAETARVVDFWKQQAAPDYDKTLLMPPPADAEEGEGEEFDGSEDPMYQDAVRVVCEMGKASTSTLQRRLRLGYGRAARILDMMQRDGIIGPPDGSRPRDVLKRPDWLAEVENQLR
jgi:DNA segregation ATPase FtsK/SpoIIIE, S-DNA-T family